MGKPELKHLAAGIKPQLDCLINVLTAEHRRLEESEPSVITMVPADSKDPRHHPLDAGFPGARSASAHAQNLPSNAELSRDCSGTSNNCIREINCWLDYWKQGRKLFMSDLGLRWVDIARRK